MATVKGHPSDGKAAALMVETAEKESRQHRRGERERRSAACEGKREREGDSVMVMVTATAAVRRRGLAFVMGKRERKGFEFTGGFRRRNFYLK